MMKLFSFNNLIIYLIIICYNEIFDEYHERNCDKNKKSKLTEVKILSIKKKEIISILENEKKYILINDIPVLQNRYYSYIFSSIQLIEKNTNFRKSLYIIYPVLFSLDVIVSIPSFLFHSYISILWSLRKT